jgi:hypothetical protein
MNELTCVRVLVGAALPMWLTLYRCLTASGCSLGLHLLSLLYGYRDGVTAG